MVLTGYHIGGYMFEKLQNRARQLGEPLSQAWFAPYYWKPETMLDLQSQILPAVEYRGLFNDSRSLVEVRRKGKKRRSYNLLELMGHEQLFPMVGVVANPMSRCRDDHQMLIEVNIGTGNIARYAYSTGQFDLTSLEFFKAGFNFGTGWFLSTHDTMTLIGDDFVVRGQYLLFN